MTLLDELATVAERRKAIVAQLNDALKKGVSLDPLKPLLEAVDAERDRLEIAHYGAATARRLRRERKHSGQVEAVASLRAVVQAAVDENDWDLLERLVPLIKAASKKLAAMNVPRHVELVRDDD